MPAWQDRVWGLRGAVRAVALAAGLGLAVAALPAFAARTTPPADAVDCEALAAEAGRAAGLPDGLLPAIARIESGRARNGAMRAWPWTLNHAGRGLYFDSPAAAMAYLRDATSAGRTNIDVGCMLINHYWHAQAFDDLAAMLDPATNVAYAVRFLTDLHRRHGSWAEAVRHYHSPDPDRGTRYLARFSQARARILDRPAQDAAPPLTAAAAAPPRPRVAGHAAPAEPAAKAPAGARPAPGTAAPASGFGAWPLQPGRAEGPRALVALAAGPALPGWRATSRTEADALYAALIALAESRSGLGNGLGRP